ncbi:MAG: uroporphyrinogen decarboxylase family protein [Actinomycetota bacterium]
MTPREIALSQLLGKDTTKKAVFNPVSSVTVEQMEIMNSFFPQAHTDAKKMYELARASYEVLGYDAVMPLFSVVIESYAAGCKVDWGSIDKMPTITGKLWRGYEDIEFDRSFLDNHAVKAVLDCISMLKQKYPDVLVIGKVFGPWTLSYHFFGVEDFLIKTITHPREVKDILKKLTGITLWFAEEQIKAGADAVTVADHATRDLCSPDSYRDFLIPIHTYLAGNIEAPTILHICGNTADRIEYICQTNMNAFHFESKVDACNAVKLAKKRIALIGNINNPSTLLFGSPEDVAEKVKYAIDCGVDIIGPECAVPLRTPLKNLKMIARAAREYRG